MADLIDELRRYEPGTEVRLAIQPRMPQEHGVGPVAGPTASSGSATAGIAATRPTRSPTASAGPDRKAFTMAAATFLRAALHHVDHAGTPGRGDA